jgi:MFS family permease
MEPEPTHAPAQALRRPLVEPALVVFLAGVCAALHVGKLPPAIPALQQALAISLVQAGFLLSLMQLAGMSVGLVFGALADGLGPRRSMLMGLMLLAAASAAGAWAHDVTALMVLRVCEGCGFLLVVLAAPALLRQLVAPARLGLMLGLWGAYMPLATMLALLGGPWVIGAMGWPAWWLLLAVATAAMAAWLVRAVAPAAVTPADAAAAAHEASTARRGITRTTMAALAALPARLMQTLAAPGPWLLAGAFGVYAAQWLAVIGFLPTIYAEAGLPLATTGALTAGAAAVNMVGNVVAGRWLHAGAPPRRLLYIGYTAMALGALLAFVTLPNAAQPLLPPVWRYLAVLLFSGVGGLIPATLFTLTVPATPQRGSLSATVGWMQQGSALGQFAGPPLVAWVAAWAGGWQWTWLATGCCALAGLWLSAAIARRVVARTP